MWVYKCKLCALLYIRELKKKGKLKISTTLITVIGLITISCSPKLSLEKWEGVGEGDSYLEIRDSLITFNGPDDFTSIAKIQTIAEDSIFCRYYDDVTGELREDVQFVFSNCFDKITTQINSNTYHFINTSKLDLLPKNDIEEVYYRIYDYYENLYKEYQLNSNGEIIVRNENKQEIYRKKNINHINTIYEKISILDLDKFVWMDKYSFMVSHAPCHCLEVHYNNDSKIRYCRQIHNNYIAEILNDIKAE